MHLRLALTSALLTNLLDAATTWVAITHYHAREVGLLGLVAVQQWGLVPAVAALKGSFVVLTLAFALTGTTGEPRWWRVRPHQRWMVIGALWVASVWFGYLAFHNAVAIWMLFSTSGRVEALMV